MELPSQKEPYDDEPIDGQIATRMLMSHIVKLDIGSAKPATGNIRLLTTKSHDGHIKAHAGSCHYITIKIAVRRFFSLTCLEMQECIRKVWGECNHGRAPVGLRDDLGWWFCHTSWRGGQLVARDPERQNRIAEICHELFKLTHSSPTNEFECLDKSTL